MPVRKSVTFSSRPELLVVAERPLAKDRYGTISDVIRTALDFLEQRERDFHAYRETKCIGSSVRHQATRGIAAPRRRLPFGRIGPIEQES